MDTRTNWRNGNEISLLGFGCMRLPKLGPERSNVDFEKSHRLVAYCVERGITYFDTAYYYHDGVSEPVLGGALAPYPRHSYFLADKMPLWLVKDPDHARSMFDEQCARCKTDYFDYYLCHGLGKSEEEFREGYIESGLFDHLLSLKKQGRIRNLGFSFHGSPRVMEYLLRQYDWDIAQIQCNYLDWDIQHAGTLHALLREKDVPCLIMEPLRGGNLATLTPESAALLREAAPEKSVASWGMRFAASLPGVLCVLSGMNAPEQVDDNVATFSPLQPLNDAEREILALAAERYIRTGSVPCTGCGYCMDCPSGVDIPLLFRLLNDHSCSLTLPVSQASQYAFNRHARDFHQACATLPPEKLAANCTACGCCEARCPQAIPIARRMREITAILTAFRAHGEGSPWGSLRAKAQP